LESGEKNKSRTEEGREGKGKKKEVN